MQTNHPSEPLVDVAEAGPITVVSIRAASLTDTKLMTQIAQEVRAISTRNQPPNILLDFHCVTRISIDFLDKMRTVVEEIEKRGGTIQCCSLREEMRAILKILGVDPRYVGHSVQHAVMRYATWLEKRKQITPKAAISKWHALM